MIGGEGSIGFPKHSRFLHSKKPTGTLDDDILDSKNTPLGKARSRTKGGTENFPVRKVFCSKQCSEQDGIILSESLELFCKQSVNRGSHVSKAKTTILFADTTKLRLELPSQ